MFKLKGSAWHTVKWECAVGCIIFDCDGSHITSEHPPHTSLQVERRQSDEANQCMGMIRRP